MATRYYDDDALDERGIVKDGRSVRVPMMFMDSVQRDIVHSARITDGGNDPLALHRPGYRVVDGAARGADPRMKAYDEYCTRLQDAWKTDAPPAGAYPLSAGEGSACTFDGAPGVLVREGDWLVCKPAASKPSRSDSATKDARAEAYDAYCAELTNAWRAKP
jgi:hypothetical protein